MSTNVVLAASGSRYWICEFSFFYTCKKYFDLVWETFLKKLRTKDVILRDFMMDVNFGRWRISQVPRSTGMEVLWDLSDELIQWSGPRTTFTSSCNLGQVSCLSGPWLSQRWEIKLFLESPQAPLFRHVKWAPDRLKYQYNIDT